MGKNRRRKNPPVSGTEHRNQNPIPPEDWVPIEAPPNLDEMLQKWMDSPEHNIGWCLLCDSPIHDESHLIPGTSSHNCAAGRKLEEHIQSTQADESETNRN